MPAVAVAWPERNSRVPHEKSVVRTGEIKALSGLRIVAAVWVVLFHFRPWLEQVAPGFRSALAPVLNCGAQGVDLFFILSGFVLTWNYLDRMGESFSMRATLHFLWLRLARVWPVYLVTLHLAARVDHLHVVRRSRAVEGRRPAQRRQLCPPGRAGATLVPAVLRRVELGRTRLVDQRRMAGVSVVRGVGAGDFPDRPGDEGKGPAVAGNRGLAAARAAAAGDRPFLHAVELASANHHAVHRWGPGLRRGSQVAADRPCPPWRRLSVPGARRRHRRHSLFLDANPVPKVSDSSGLVDVLFVPLVVTLAIGVGTLPRLLSTRVMVYGGYISFSLYMVHELVHTAWNWFTAQFEIVLTPSWSAKLIVVGVLGVAVLGAAVLYHFVEEPARSGCAEWSRPRPQTDAADTPTPVPRPPIRRTASFNLSTAPGKCRRMPSLPARADRWQIPNPAAPDDKAAVL